MLWPTSGWCCVQRAGTTARLSGYLYGDDAAAYVECEEPAWKGWLEG